MNTFECIKTRRSIRKFKAEIIPHSVIEEIVGYALFAPSWKNTQVVRYNVIENRDIINKIADEAVYGFTFNSNTIKGCAALVAVSVVKGRCGYEKDGSFSTDKGDKWEMFDSGVAVQTFCIAAHEKGIGSVIMGIFEDKKISEFISLPEEQEINALIAIGYHDISPQAPKRKDVSTVLSFI